MKQVKSIIIALTIVMAAGSATSAATLQESTDKHPIQTRVVLDPGTGGTGGK